MDEIIKRYLIEHLSIRITDERHGYNGEYRNFELLIDDEVFSSDSVTLTRDEG